MRLTDAKTRDFLRAARARAAKALALVTIACTWLSPQSAAAQGGTTSVALFDAGIQPGRASTLPTVIAPPAAFDGMERPDTGSVNMNIPLFKLPGRGLDLNMNLNYDGTHYQRDVDSVRRTVRVDSTREPFLFTSYVNLPFDFLYDFYKGWPGYGFYLGFGAFIKHSQWTLDCVEWQTDPTAFCGFFGQPPAPAPGPHNRGFTYIDQTGAHHSFTRDRFNGGVTQDGLAKDGSDLRYVEEGNNPVVYYPDGTKVIFGQRSLLPVDSTFQSWFCEDNGQRRRSCTVYDEIRLPTMIIDVHGNHLTIEYHNAAGHIKKIVDTVGREIRWNYHGPDVIWIDVPEEGDPTRRREVVRFYTNFRNRAHSFANQQFYDERIKTLHTVYFPGTGISYHFDYTLFGHVYKFEKRIGLQTNSVTKAITGPGQMIARTQYDYHGSPERFQTLLPGIVPTYTQRTDTWIEDPAKPPVTAVQKFSLTWDANTKVSTTTVEAPDGTLAQTMRKAYAPPVNLTATDEGLVVEQKVLKGGKTFYHVQNDWGLTRGGPRLLEQRIFNDAGQRKKITYRYWDARSTDSPNTRTFSNLREVKEFDFDSDREVRRTEYQFETRMEYIDRWLVRLPTSEKVYSVGEGGAATLATQVDYEYDTEPLTTYPEAIPRHSLGAALNRGNLTAKKSNTNAANPSQGQVITHRAVYDMVGNVVKQIEPGGATTEIEYPANLARSLPTRTSITPDPGGTHASSAPLTTTVGYDLHTGNALTTRDQNDQETRYEYNDPARRLKRVSHADGGSITYEYDDTFANRSLKTRNKQDDSTTLESVQFYDGLDRVFKAQNSVGGGSYTTIDSRYDVMGRLADVSNPYFAGLKGVPSPDNRVWTTKTYDPLGRATKLATADGAETRTDYHGRDVLVTDQAGRQRLSRSNVLGQMTDVWEIKPADAETEPITFPGRSEVAAGYRTSYAYDSLDNLVRVTQGRHQTRTFTYDSLSRVLTAENPENGVVRYDYFPDGSLKERIDARGVKTSYTYDAMKRLTRRSYTLTGATPAHYVAAPDVEYFYDGKGLPEGTPEANFKGHTTACRAGALETRYTAYDAGGRVKQQQQITDQTYTLHYNYDLLGNLVSQQYPSGRVVTTEYDAGGRLSGVKHAGGYYMGGSPADADTRIQYTAHGAVSAARLGNGLWETTRFNSRLQAEQVGLGASPTDTGTARFNYTYGLATATGLDLTKNNGNVQSQSVSAPGMPTLTQTYLYDELNRLRDAREANAHGQTWAQVFAYDQYGNRSLAPGTTPGLGDSNPDIAPGTNRIRPRPGEFFDYDPAGNLVRDAEARYFAYDGENRQAKFHNNAGTAFATYVYDGDGRRVKKIEGGTATVFVYNVLGQIVAEYSNAAPVATGTRYLMLDSLGTPRVVTDVRGEVKGRHDYLPFGGEIESSLGRTGAGQYAAADGLRQKFTSRERDKETGLDYFLARYYSNAQGRFTSPDEFKGGPGELFAIAAAGADKQVLPYTDITNPQSLNKYQYCFNNPLRYVDPDGHQGEETWTQWILRLISASPRPRPEPEHKQWKVDKDMVAGYVSENANRVGNATIKVLEGTGLDYGAIDLVRQIYKGNTRDAMIAGGFVAINIATAGRGKKAVVIGESMVTRVIPAAKELGAGWYKTRGAISVEKNARWIRDQVRQGKLILDIGIDKMRERSAFYMRELEELNKLGLERIKVDEIVVDGQVFEVYKWVEKKKK